MFRKIGQLHRSLCIMVGLAFFLLLLIYSSFSNRNSYIYERRAVIIDELLIDRRGSPTLQERLELMRAEIPSVPLAEMLNATKIQVKLRCAPLTKNIEYHNDYWQVARARNLTYYLFGAYYDCRETVPKAPLVRLLAMINERGFKGTEYPTTYCQMWFKEQTKPLIVRVHEHKVVWKWGAGSPGSFFPTLMSCAVPKGKVPDMISLVSGPCDKATNLLKVVYEPQQLEDAPNVSSEDRSLRFAICVKALDFLYDDMSWRLIEWLELMRLLGTSKVIFYSSPMHANMSRVLQHYMEESPDFVELRPLSLGRGEPNLPHFHHYIMASNYFNTILNEMIPYNDCFYRNMYRFDYIGVFDIDEVIMPLGNVTNWTDLVTLARTVPDYLGYTSESCQDWVSFCFRNVYYPRYADQPKYFKQLPSFFYMLQHVKRTALHCNRFDAAKCLHSTRYAVGLHNHFAIHWTNEASCAAKSVPIEYAQMQHYREPDNKTWLLDPVVDDNIWRFQPQLQDRTLAKYKRLGFLPSLSELTALKEQQRKADEMLLQKLVGVQQSNIAA